jgi:hypothetical protein
MLDIPTPTESRIKYIQLETEEPQIIKKRVDVKHSKLSLRINGGQDPGGHRRKKICGMASVVAWDDAQDNRGRLSDIERGGSR